MGCPEERFREDALRMLRAVRFAAQLGFTIDDETWQALKDNARLIEKISAERIREELQKLIMSDRPEKINFLCDSGLVKHIYEPLDEVLREASAETARELAASEKSPQLRWALFLSRLGQKNGERLLKELKFDTKTLRTVTTVLGERELLCDSFGIKKTAERLGDEAYMVLLKYHIAKNTGGADEILDKYNKIKENNECIYMKDLKINGTVLKDMGITDGRQIGNILKAALEQAQMDNSSNNEDFLKKFAYERANPVN